GRARPTFAARPVADLPRARSRRDDLARVVTCDGGSRSLRPPAAPPRRAGPRRRVAGLAAAAHGLRRARRGVPRPAGGAMTWRVTAATSRRVLRQLRRDPRTLALVFVVPPLLIT